VALKKRGIEYLHFDAKQVGYTISWFPPQTRFFSSNERIAIAGVPLQTPDQQKATREQYLAYLRCVVEQFDLQVNTYEPVTHIGRLAEGGFEIRTRHGGDNREWRAEKIVLATGGTAWPRKLNVPGDHFPHVRAHWNDPHDYFRKRVLVVGGRNSAVETAMRLHHAGAYVSLCYRQSDLPAKSIKYWLLPEITGLIKAGRIKTYFNSQVKRISLSEVELSPTNDMASPQTIEVDFVIPQIGYEADMSLCKLAGVELRGPGQVPMYDEATMQSSSPGVYLCGTVIGGTQERYEIFIENGHVHVERIAAHLMGKRAAVEEVVYASPES